MLEETLIEITQGKNTTPPLPLPNKQTNKQTDLGFVDWKSSPRRQGQLTLRICVHIAHVKDPSAVENHQKRNQRVGRTGCHPGNIQNLKKATNHHILTSRIILIRSCLCTQFVHHCELLPR